MSSNTRRNLAFALAVLALHLGLGYGLLTWKRAYPPGPPMVVSLQLEALGPQPPHAQRRSSSADLTIQPFVNIHDGLWRLETAARQRPSPARDAGQGALSVAALPEAAASATSEPASAPLNLALPKTWKAEERLSPAQQAVHDPRANSPRYSATEALARRMANQAEVIQLADGGTMTRYPDGRCTRTLPNRANALVPMDPHLQSGIAHGGNCFDDKPGSALQHARPR
ncbi:hypothetical protein [Inhella gelatinilytica]|uniref:Uncharacterized protein n=1 Tax=Inhella gelatinilytica TaxID=2795030 RepID=A0A931ITW0_9BURK|nr:hypothetical protein [Inhella gelatinilytica]MBH9552682.1 hypothetical protein [Inhella gelatinilytica]